MTLEEFRKNKGLSIRQLAVMLGIPRSTAHRVCKHASLVITVPIANKIVAGTGGVVNYADLGGNK